MPKEDLKPSSFELIKKEGCIVLRKKNCSDDIKVKISWLNPITGRNKKVSICDTNKKELCLLNCLEDLDEQSKLVATEDLDARYFIPKIIKINHAEASFGNRYWEVETNCGLRSFVMKDPQKNVVWVSESHIVMRDSLGNRYEITDTAKLDFRSNSFINIIL
jgi:hypothetical protein